MINVFLCGANGRMGQAVQEVIGDDSKKIRLAGGLSSKAEKPFQTKLPTSAKSIDVVIDFSSPEIFSDILDWAIKNKLPIVSGTTGLSLQQQKALQAAAKKIPVLWSANMSPGIAFIKNILDSISIPDDFDVHLLEYHHNKKKDSPSGTAKDLEAILKKKTKKYAGTSAIRGGGIFGVHRIDLMSDSEVIVLQHTALDRKVFARGAVHAAKWICGQKKGMYTLQQTLLSTSR